MGSTSPTAPWNTYFGLGLLTAIVMTVVIARVARRALEKVEVPEQ